MSASPPKYPWVSPISSFHSPLLFYIFNFHLPHFLLPISSILSPCLPFNTILLLLSLILLFLTCLFAAQTPIEEFTPTPAFPALQYLESVDEGGVAWRAGLRMGDFLIEVWIPGKSLCRTGNQHGINFCTDYQIVDFFICFEFELKQCSMTV